MRDDPAYVAAVQRRTDLRARVERLQAELRDVVQFLALYDRLFRRRTLAGQNPLKAS